MKDDKNTKTTEKNFSYILNVTHNHKKKENLNE